MRNHTPKKSGLTLLILWGLLATASLGGGEVQRHGLVFEKWICDTFFEGHRPDYTAKWDIPSAVNTRHGGVPVNAKAVRHGTPVDLGDALRQYDIQEPFLLVIGFWEQREDYKEFTRIVAPRIEPALWRRLWHPVTLADLERLDAIIKDRSLDFREARKQAHAMKNKPPFTEAIMVVHPKIDAHGQRRLQCSIRYSDIPKYLVPEENPEPAGDASLWGVPFPGKIPSPPREFHRKAESTPP